MENKFYDTEGEKIIEFFLESEWIKYKKQVKINKLKNDYADYRIADFYIPKYKVYVEFLGKWWDPKAKNKYIQKMNIYKKNEIPCVYIHRDNLGTLKYIFYMRLGKELADNPKLKLQLFKYNFTMCRKVISIIWLTVFILFNVVVFYSQLSQSKVVLSTRDSLLILLIVFFALATSLFTIKRVFFRKKELLQKS